jgi:hypothetical protein
LGSAKRIVQRLTGHGGRGKNSAKAQGTDRACPGLQSMIGLEKRRECYRGYQISGELERSKWRLHIKPLRPDLPILGKGALSAQYPDWNAALRAARHRIDAQFLGRAGVGPQALRHR